MKYGAPAEDRLRCKKCGAPLHPDTAAGNCLACLLRLGVKPDDADPAFDEDFPAEEEPIEAWPKLANYRILRELGQGGSAIVYAAEQIAPVRREVAVKVIKPGMDTQQVIQRFATEKQALAVMDHPHIAKVFDAGATETGRAFFAMELVAGIPLTDFCDWKNLSIADRIELFLPVCQAVQHAHQKGLIHRDLKPSNILVGRQDGAPAAKVIDFGIAKATGEDRLQANTVFTAFELFLGTPAYMSPEQTALGGIDIDTRSDIYSLGAVLYELLCGKLPFDDLGRAGLDELRRKIRLEEPARPSARGAAWTVEDQQRVAGRRGVVPAKMRQIIRGDLDAIVMKALEKDRTRRFATAAGLAIDLRRYLDGAPVIARPASVFYQAQKFARRHRPALLAAGLILCSIITAAVIGTVQAVKARRAEQRALTESRKSQEVAFFLENMLLGVEPAHARGEDTKLLRGILDRTAERLGVELSDSVSAAARLRQILGWTYHKIGDETKGEANLREAVRLYRTLPEEPVGLAGSLNQLAQVVLPRSLPEAESIAREAFSQEARLSASLDTPAQRELATYGIALAKILLRKGHLDEAQAVNQTWLAFQKRVLGEESPAVAWTLTGLGQVENQRSHLAAAEQYHREALRLRRKIYGEESLDVSNSLRQLGSILSAQGRWAEAEPLLREARAIDRKFLGPQHPDLILSCIPLAELLIVRGDLEEAEALVREGLALGPVATHGRAESVFHLVGEIVAARQSRGEMEKAKALGEAAAAVHQALTLPQ